MGEDHQSLLAREPSVSWEVIGTLTIKRLRIPGEATDKHDACHRFSSAHRSPSPKTAIGHSLWRNYASKAVRPNPSHSGDRNTRRTGPGRRERILTGSNAHKSHPGKLTELRTPHCCWATLDNKTVPPLSLNLPSQIHSSRGLHSITEDAPLSSFERLSD